MPITRSVGISISPCEDAARIGYDDRQINRIMIRIAEYFLDRDMRIIFGQDWREDGVMQAIADMAAIVAANSEIEETEENGENGGYRMINLIATPTKPRAATEASEESGRSVAVLSVDEIRHSSQWQRELGIGSGETDWIYDPSIPEGRAGELTELRAWLTALLAPGCRICLGGKMHGYQGDEPGVIEEAGLALERNKPLYLLGGFGGATRAFIESETYAKKYRSDRYWTSENGLDEDEKKALFETTDLQVALELIAKGIASQNQSALRHH